MEENMTSPKSGGMGMGAWAAGIIALCVLGVIAVYAMQGSVPSEQAAVDTESSMKTDSMEKSDSVVDDSMMQKDDAMMKDDGVMKDTPQ
jgi:hypothetical protein